MKKILSFLIPTLLLSGIASAEVSAETAFVFNTFLFIFGGILVMFMALGFAMLEAGFVRKKNIALAMLDIQFIEIGQLVEIHTDFGQQQGVVVEKPFFDPKKAIASS